MLVITSYFIYIYGLACNHISNRGQVAEWSNVPDSKSGVRASVPWVRIPPCPPPKILKALDYSRAFLFSAGLNILFSVLGLFAVLSHEHVKVKVSVAADVREIHPSHFAWPTFLQRRQKIYRAMR